MSETVNISLTVNGQLLDPSQVYIIEIKEDDFDQKTAKGLTNALQQLGIKHVLVASKTGEAINTVQVPPQSQNTQEEA